MYEFNNQTLTKPGTYIQQLPSIFGCDSLVTLHLAQNAFYPTRYIDTVVCPGTAVFGHLGVGVYADTIRRLTRCDSIRITNISYGEDLYIPNVFSPNGDGDNDHFQVFGATPFPGTIFSVQVFNRWGSTVFSKTNAKANTPLWDGTYRSEPVPAGTYVYAIRYKCGSEVVQKQGELQVLR